LVGLAVDGVTGLAGEHPGVMMAGMDLREAVADVIEAVRECAPSRPGQMPTWPGGWLYRDAAGTLHGPQPGQAWPTAHAAHAGAPRGAEVVWQPYLVVDGQVVLLDAVHYEVHA